MKRFASSGLRRIIRAGSDWTAFLVVTTVALLTPVSPGLYAATKQRPERPARPIEAAVNPVGPLLAVVSIASQRLTIYDRNGLVLQSPVSSGQSGYETPQGVFSIIERNKEHFSNLYNDAPMPNMQRITWSGVALHAGNLPGYPASHGCIRLPYAVSERLFELTKLGTRVIVASHDVAPVAFSHQALFTAMPEPMPVDQLPNAAPPPVVASIGLPMMLGAAFIGPASAVASDLSIAEPPAEPVRPPAMSRAAWAAELTGKVPAAEVKARDARLAATAAAKMAQKAATASLAADQLRSIEAARFASLEKAASKATTPAAIARLEAAKLVVETRLQALVQTVDLLRAEEAAKSEAAALTATAAASAAAERIAAATAARNSQRQLKPVSVFISRKTGRLYARQGFQPLFDAPVTIAQPTAPIGTHVFTAVDQKSGSDEMVWSAVTVIGGQIPLPVAANGRAKRGVAAVPAQPARPVLTATAALDRIAMPDDVRQKIGWLMVPGSSLIISDQGISSETGKGTDFVILTQ